MNTKNAIIATIVTIITTVCLATTSAPARAAGDCGNGEFKCGYGQTWTCCNNGDRCCAYTATDNKTWYVCKLSNQQCP